MVIMRDTPPPLPGDMVRDLRSTLAGSYGHRLLNHEGNLVLAVRVPHDVPDRTRDLPLAADTVPEDEAALARDILLIGAEKVIRIEPIPLRDLVREKLRDDAPVSKEVRRGLAREYGAALFNPATRRDWAIAVRLPRASYREATPEDLTALQKAVEAVFAQPKAAAASMCYIVADNDYRRAPLEEFVRTLRGEVPLKPMKVNNYAVAGDSRSVVKTANAANYSSSPFGMLMTASAKTDAKMEANKQRKAAPSAPTPPAAPEPLQVQVNMPTAPPFAAPTSLILEAREAPAPAPSARLAPMAADPVMSLATQFQARGFEVLTDVADLGLALAAHQADGKRILVQRATEATPQGVQGLAAKCAELDAHAGVLLADAMAPGAWLAAAGTSVTIIPAAHADAWVL